MHQNKTNYDFTQIIIAVADWGTAMVPLDRNHVPEKSGDKRPLG